ncbi:hypothetical protein HYT02_04150 [Candidatus Gottesmanbacteria bacterium]|nr:hypothetical protein [Candidatus Gottesmanbacteria bacterium]
MTKSAENKLIFLIASFCEDSKEWIDVFSSPLPRISGFPKRDKSIRLGISGLLKKELLDYKEVGETIVIRPTQKAFQMLSLEYPFYNNFISKWDGKFHLISYDLPESNRKIRDGLRWILKSYKLGLLSQSIYVSAYDIKKDLYNNINNKVARLHLPSARADGGQAKDAVSIFTITLNMEQLPQFCKLVWNIDKLNSSYNQIISSLNSAISKIKLRRTRIEVFRKSFIEYKKLLESDPGIPFELIKNENYHLQIRKLFKKLQKML